MSDRPDECRPALRAATATELREDVTHYQGATWQCNCIVVSTGDHALVIDACWNHRDMEGISHGLGDTEQSILITHGDIDHICGVGLFERANVAAGQGTAERVGDGSAARELRSESAKWGLAFPDALRVDQVLEAGREAQVGPFRVSPVEAAGHAVDGLGYVLPEQGIFAVGDYLMKSQMPMVWWSFTEARRSTERLLDALEGFDVEWVVPGHGPLLSVGEARQIGHADLTYMEEVERSADQAHRGGVSPREWLLAVESVPVPRPAHPDISMLRPTLLNAAATFRDRGVDGRLPWQLNMA